MQVSKWGNSLAVRLPKEGDEIEVSVAGKRDFRVARDQSKESALEQTPSVEVGLPSGFQIQP
jgi:antitoxin MazE